MIKQLKLWITTLIFAFSLNAYASEWQIVPTESSLTFTATQNNSPLSGEFKRFKGSINFDPAQLATSNVNITVDTGSVSASYQEVADTLKTPDWFDIKIFPEATFKATQFTKTGDNSYKAEGTLTIRDKTVPVTLNFNLDTYSQTKAHATGSTTLKRTAFGVGRGDWAKTTDVKDDVQVNFKLSCIKK